MKALFSIIAVLFATPVFAGYSVIQCSANSDSDQMITIRVDAETSTVQGLSIHNINWSQTAEATYQAATAIGTVNPMAGIRVYVPDTEGKDMYARYVDIEYSVFQAGHDGLVKLNGDDDYHCY